MIKETGTGLPGSPVAKTHCSQYQGAQVGSPGQGTGSHVPQLSRSCRQLKDPACHNHDQINKHIFFKKKKEMGTHKETLAPELHRALLSIRIVRNKLAFYKPPCLWYLVLAAQTDEDTHLIWETQRKITNKK